MNKATKSNINLLLPFIGASFSAYKFGYSKGAKPQQIAILFALVFLFLWVITASVTKAVAKNAEIQNAGSVPGYDPNYNPAYLATQLHDDIYCIFCFRNYDLYDQLAALTDYQMVTLAQYYKATYSASLSADVMNENSGILHEALWSTLKNRFTTLNIN